MKDIISKMVSTAKSDKGCDASRQISFAGWPAVWHASVTPMSLIACPPPPELKECPSSPADCSCATLDKMIAYIDSRSDCPSAMKDFISTAKSDKGCDASRQIAFVERAVPQSSMSLALVGCAGAIGALAGAMIAFVAMRREVAAPLSLLG
jgi:hypothetical protein